MTCHIVLLEDVPSCWRKTIRMWTWSASIVLYLNWSIVQSTTTSVPWECLENISQTEMLPPSACTRPAIVARCLFSDVSCRIRQRPFVRWRKKMWFIGKCRMSPLSRRSEDSVADVLSLEYLRKPVVSYGAPYAATFAELWFGILLWRPLGLPGRLVVRRLYIDSPIRIAFTSIIYRLWCTTYTTSLIFYSSQTAPFPKWGQPFSRKPMIMSFWTSNNRFCKIHRFCCFRPPSAIHYIPHLCWSH